VNLSDRKQKTPLYYAIEAPAENSDVVVRLIKEGAKIDAATVYYWTPLLRATQKQYHQILPILIENKANVNARLTTNNNKTALHIACEQGDLEAVRILVKAGADINAENKDKETPFVVA
jgi:ankyrin repeat protein